MRTPWLKRGIGGNGLGNGLGNGFGNGQAIGNGLGIGRGIGDTRHGTDGWPDTFRPITAPTSVSGRMTKSQMHSTTTIVVKGMAPVAR